MSLNQRKLKYLINKADSLGNQYMVLYLLGKKKNQLLGSQTECMLIMGPHTNFTGKSIKKLSMHY